MVPRCFKRPLRSNGLWMILLLVSTVVRRSQQEELQELVPAFDSSPEEQRSAQQEPQLSKVHDASSDVPHLSIALQSDEAVVVRVVGGNPITMQQYPFFVQADAEVSQEYCGGSLVASDVVLTSAQCQSEYKQPPSTTT